jgi:hypothetical protein
VRKLVDYWKKNFDGPGEQERWVRYLSDYAGRTKAGAAPAS